MSCCSNPQREKRGPDCLNADGTPYHRCNWHKRQITSEKVTLEGKFDHPLFDVEWFKSDMRWEEE